MDVNAMAAIPRPCQNPRPCRLSRLLEATGVDRRLCKGESIKARVTLYAYVDSPASKTKKNSSSDPNLVVYSCRLDSFSIEATQVLLIT